MNDLVARLYKFVEKTPDITISSVIIVALMKSFLRECGHMVAAKFMAIKDARFVFKIHKISRISIPSPAVFINPVEFILLPSWMKQVIISAGIVVDLLVVAIILTMPHLDGTSQLTWNSLLFEI